MSTALKSFDLGDPSLVDALVGMGKELRKAENKPMRDAAHAAAYRLLFGVFDTKNGGGGEWVGSAVKAALKIGNGGKAVKGRTVTETMIAGITAAEVQTNLDAVKVSRANSIAARITWMEAHAFTAVEVSTYRDTATKDAATDFERAQEWVNVAWARIPAAMKVIRTCGNGRVRTLDGLEDVAVDFAFERVILNRSVSAKAFAKALTK